MGLDMYLYRKERISTIQKSIKYVDENNHEKEIELKEGYPENTYNLDVVTEAAYWRKANQIHKWFVDNVQDGVDDCREYYVSRGALVKLLEVCKKVKANSKLVDKNGIKVIEDPTTAKKLLPTCPGFFFGQYEYDESYMYDIDQTIEQLEEIFKKDKTSSWEVSYSYTSSW